jgi:hypothetical protein
LRSSPATITGTRLKRPSMAGKGDPMGPLTARFWGFVVVDVRNENHMSPPQRSRALLLLLLGLSLLLTGCGSYSSQAEKLLTQGSSEVAGSAYVLKQLGDGAVSAPYARTSLQEYAKAMQQSNQNLKSLRPPPRAKAQHERAVEALSRARSLVQDAGQRGVSGQEATGLAQRLEGLKRELKP